MAAESTTPRQGRRIADQEEGERATVETGEEGVSFVKNHTNEIIVFKDGGTHRFKKSLETYTDEKLIAKIREVADKYGIFERQ